MRSPYPDFFIVGAAKAGTTSLVDMLRAHPGVFFPHEKEPHHFTLRGGQEWSIRDSDRVLRLAETLPYGTEAAYLSLYTPAPTESLRGDASTQYLVDPAVAAAIHAVRPDAKIVICLRDPVDRAYSAFVHARSRGEEPCGSFSDALDECEAQLRSTSFAINYLDEGRYNHHIATYRDLFGDNVLVLLFEDLTTEPQASFDRLAAFLGIVPMSLADTAASHKNPSIELSNPIARNFRLLAKRLRRALPGLFNADAIRRPYEWLLGKLGSKPPALTQADAARAYAALREDIRATERVLGRDLRAWHRHGDGAGA